MPRRAPALRRLLVVLTAMVVAGVGLTTTGTMTANGRAFAPPTPQGPCKGPKNKLETDIQGRVPLSDYTSGRWYKGYRCNTVGLAHVGGTGGFKVIRYVDRQGNVCAFYDSTLLFPRDVLFEAAEGLGVVVLDMNDPEHPRQTATLTTAAMLSPHETLLLNQKRGLLGAVLVNPRTNLGILDLYSVEEDCRHPELLSSSDTAYLGHESGFAPDGRTFYSSSAGESLAAIDVTDPVAPERIFLQEGVSYHGLRFSADGRTMYTADLGTDDGASLPDGGLRIIDVSEIQDRKPDPSISVTSSLVWPELSIPQVNEPFFRDGHAYLLEVDEYANYGPAGGPTQSSAEVGAARIIDIANIEKPKVVANLRLAVHQPGARAGEQQADPGAAVPVQGYAAHYCSVPYRQNPRIVACSMIVSGLRIFDISNIRRPVEVAYFNEPTMVGTSEANPTAYGAFAMSQPAWDVRRGHVWYTDGNSRFYVVKLVNGVQRLLAR